MCPKNPYHFTSQIKKNPAARFVVDGIAKHTPSRSETVSERLEYSSV